MSFLPYGETTGVGWFGAMGTSAVLHGAVAVGLVTLGGTTLTIAAPAPAPPPEFELSVEDLDADTLAGLLEQTGLAASEGIDEVEPDPATSNETDPVETAAVETVVEPDAVEAVVDPNAMPVEIPTASIDEVITASDATLEAIESVAITPDEIAPLVQDPVETQTPLVVEDVTPSPIMSQTATNLAATAIEPSIATPVTPTGVETVASVGEAVGSVTPTGVETIASNLTETAPENPQPAAPPPAPPTAQDLAVGDLIARIQRQPQPTCLIALPRRDGVDGVGLAMLAARDGAMEDFAASLLTADDTDIRQTRALIDPRQCPALDFVTQTAVYPAVQVGVAIGQTTLGSGDVMTGTLRGVGGGRFLSLVLVDDNGVVSDLARFTATSGNEARFDVPVSRFGLARETRPLVIAIVSDRAPTELRARMGQLAQDVFLDAVLDPLGDVRIGLVAVDIR